MIRDRVTVVTKSGREHELVVDKQGGSIIAEVPRKTDTWFIATIADKNGNATREVMAVAADDISSVVFDSAPKKESKKRSAV